MRKVTIILALFISINAAAQTPRPAGDSSHRAKAWAAAVNVDAVLDKYVKAIGGRARIEKISSRVSKGTFELESLAGVKGSVEIYQKAPNKQVGIINIPGIGTDAAGFDGTIAWE